MGPGAQVGKLPLLVEGDGRLLGQVVDQLHLIGLAPLLHKRHGLRPGQLEPLQLQLLLADLAHLRLQLGQIPLGEGLGGVEVVVEAVVDGRADGQLHLRVEPLHGLGQHMGAGVPIGLAVLFVLEGIPIVFFGHRNSSLCLGVKQKCLTPGSQG